MEEGSHRFEVGGHHLDRGQRGELSVTCPVVTVLVRMNDEQRKSRIILAGQESEHGFRDRHLLRVGDGSRVDEKGSLGADELSGAGKFRCLKCWSRASLSV